jgi:diguanylate cyclase (GGDEF)-like protein
MAEAGRPLSQRSVASLRAGLEAEGRYEPKIAVALAEEGLRRSAAGNVEDELWFLAALARAWTALRGFDKAMVHADRGVALASDLRHLGERLAFQAQRIDILLDADRHGEAGLALRGLTVALQTEVARDPRPAIKALQGRVLRQSGTVAYNHSRLPDAMALYTQALQVFDGLGDGNGQALALNDIARVQMLSGKLAEAEGSGRKALAIAERMRDENLQATLHLTLANVYGTMGDADRQIGEMKQAQALAERAGNARVTQTCMVNLADAYLTRKDYPACLRLSEAALAFSRGAHDRTSEAVCLVNHGIALNRLGRGTEGMSEVLAGIAIFKAIGSTSYLPEVTGALAEEWAFNRDFRKAFEAHVAFKTLSDGILKAENQKRTAEITASYESDRQEQRIAVLVMEQRGQRITRNLWGLAAVLAVGALTALLVGRRRLSAANDSLQEMSLRDPLTGLHNRRYLSARIEEDVAQINRLHRNAHHPANSLAGASNVDVAFLLIDIDHFKQVNDTFGHHSGDAVLQQVAAILIRAMRDSDTVVRWGGEEFFVVAKHTDRESAFLVSERIRMAVEAHVFDLGNGVTTRNTCSVGFACYPFSSLAPSVVPWSKVAEISDQCLYAAKASGRNLCVGVHSVHRNDLGLAQRVEGAVNVAELVADGTLKAMVTGDAAITWPR